MPLAKVRLYGQVATGEIGWLPDDHEFVLPENGYMFVMIVLCFYTALEHFTGMH
jgi:hypothetical protein